MPIYDMFGEPVYSKEELKEIENKKKADLKKQLDAQKKKQQEEQKTKEQTKGLESEKETLKKCLQDIIDNKAADEDSKTEEIQEDLDSIADADKSAIKKLQAKYKKQLKSYAEKNSEKKYKYPFTLHLAGRNMETDHIFEEGKEYSESEIVSKMREHQYYDFAGKVTFEYLKDDNVLLPIFQQHKKG